VRGGANLGVGWEEVLQAWHDRYRAEGRAVVFRTPPPVQLLSRIAPGGEFRARFKGKGPPDYAGVALGVPVSFEAKDCSSGEWAFGGLELHQAEAFDDWWRSGGTAFVAIRFGRRAFVLPWDRLGPVWRAWHTRVGRAKAGEGKLLPTRCAELGFLMPHPGDWLGALQTHGAIS
jgi:penicillin-binding protein-related factor A (putative recombinase)